MKVTEIEVSAGRTFNHPHESYSNFRVDVRLRARVEESGGSGLETRLLQKRAMDLVAAEEERIRGECEDEYNRKYRIQNPEIDFSAPEDEPDDSGETHEG